ncbi:MAG: hypothetical protein ACRDI2_24450, partial [Chloroflexota bacterium]
VTDGLDTLVQRWWDRIHQTTQIVLVLAGSGFSFMEGLTGARGRYTVAGRHSWQCSPSITSTQRTSCRT